MTRAWLYSTKGKIRGVLDLTDEQALARLERGEHIRPLVGTDKLIAVIADEVTGE